MMALLPHLRARGITPGNVATALQNVLTALVAHSENER